MKQPCFMVLSVLLLTVSYAQPALAQGIVEKIDEIELRLSCAEERLGLPPIFEEVGRTQMTVSEMTSDAKDRDLSDARLELPSIVRGRQVMVQYNFSRFLGEISSNGVVNKFPWIMYRLIVDGVERPGARAIVSGRHATHSGVWMGEIVPGDRPVVIEVEYAARDVVESRKVNEPYKPVANVGDKYQAYQAAQVVVYLISPPPKSPKCKN